MRYFCHALTGTLSFPFPPATTTSVTVTHITSAISSPIYTSLSGSFDTATVNETSSVKTKSSATICQRQSLEIQNGIICYRVWYWYIHMYVYCKRQIFKGENFRNFDNVR